MTWEDDILGERVDELAEDSQGSIGSNDNRAKNTTLDEIWAAVTTGVKKGPTSAVVQVSPVIIVHLARPDKFLHTLDRLLNLHQTLFKS
jgi:hypothetical protein